jgi:hypothetical protein
MLRIDHKPTIIRYYTCTAAVWRAFGSGGVLRCCRTHTLISGGGASSIAGRAALCCWRGGAARSSAGPWRLLTPHYMAVARRAADGARTTRPRLQLPTRVGGTSLRRWRGCSVLVNGGCCGPNYLRCAPPLISSRGATTLRCRTGRVLRPGGGPLTHARLVPVLHIMIPHFTRIIIIMELVSQLRAALRRTRGAGGRRCHV